MRPRQRQTPQRKTRGKRVALWLLAGVVIVSALPMLVIRFVDPPTSSFIQLNIRAHNKDIKHQWRDIEDVSLYFPVAVMASEDQQFPHHFGFDFRQIISVIGSSEEGMRRGASTISQQTVKNLFLWPGRSMLRKGIEAWLTLWLELIVPKKRILEIYINYAQFGVSVFGVGAASEYYFGIPASQLSPRQSALIAACLPTPSRSDPANPSPYLLERAAYIEDQMPRIGGRRVVREL